MDKLTAEVHVLGDCIKSIYLYLIHQVTVINLSDKYFFYNVDNIEK